MQRSDLINVYIRSTQTRQDQENGRAVILYPTFTPVTRRNSSNPKTYTPDLSTMPSVLPEKFNKAMPADLNGEEFYFILEGDKDTVIREVRPTYEAKGDALNL